MPTPTPAGPAGAASGGASDAPWTTRRLLGWITDHLRSRRLESPRVVAEMLLAHVLRCERLRLYMEPERPATPPELADLRGLVARAAAGEPVHYLVGEATFYWRSFEVGTCTLIPQPSTETLVDRVLEHFRRTGTGTGTDAGTDADTDTDTDTDADAEGRPGEDPAGRPVRALKEVISKLESPPLLADVGTGTGCIAVSLAAQLPGAHVIATDIVADALALARRNAERYGVAERIAFELGDGLEPLRASGRRFDAICANPPYVLDDEVPEMEASVRDHVARTAWSGGAEGLDVVAPIIAGAPALLAPGGLLAIEIAHRSRDRALELARAQPELEDVDVLKDHEGLWRVLVGKRGNGQ